jgi:hypothetical protein
MVKNITKNRIKLGLVVFGSFEFNKGGEVSVPELPYQYGHNYKHSAHYSVSKFMDYRRSLSVP